VANDKVKFSVTSPAVAAAIDNDVKAQIAEGKSIIARYRPYIGLVDKGNAFADATTARAILLKVRDGIVAHRKRVHDLRPVAKLQDSRVSELVSIMRLGEWKCWPTVLGYFDGHDFNFDNLLTVSKFVRSEVGSAKEMKGNANAAPSKDRILRALKVRKTQRRGTAETSNVANVRNPETSLAVIKRQTRGLAKWFGKDKASAARFIDAIMKAVANVEAEAKRVVKARDAAAEAEAA